MGMIRVRVRFIIIEVDFAGEQPLAPRSVGRPGNLLIPDRLDFLRVLFRHFRGNVNLARDPFNAQRKKKLRGRQTIDPHLSIEWFPPDVP